MIKLSWEDIERITDELTLKIKESNFEPDYIIGITAGGLIPLYFFTKKLEIGNILIISASSYNKQKKGDLTITYLPETDLKGKKILLVDEIVETGDTLKIISETIASKYAVGEIKTVTLVVNTDKCNFYPDYYSLENWGRWVVFPWERKEFPEYFIES